MAETPNLKLPEMSAAQSQKHVTHNEALRVLDGVVQLSVKSRTLTSPPGGPSDGDRYIIGSGATGSWAGKDLNVAVCVDGSWTFLVPKLGWLCYVENENLFLTWLAGSTYWGILQAMPKHQILSTDADATIAANGPHEVRHTGTLTAGRTLSLSTGSGLLAGHRRRVTRTGGGAFNLSVNGLKNLATNTWCEVVYDGAAWYLAAYGAL